MGLFSRHNQDPYTKLEAAANRLSKKVTGVSEANDKTIDNYYRSTFSDQNIDLLEDIIVAGYGPIETRLMSRNRIDVRIVTAGLQVGALVLAELKPKPPKSLMNRIVNTALQGIYNGVKAEQREIEDVLQFTADNIDAKRGLMVLEGSELPTVRYGGETYTDIDSQNLFISGLGSMIGVVSKVALGLGEEAIAPDPLIKSPPGYTKAQQEMLNLADALALHIEREERGLLPGLRNIEGVE